MVCCLLICFTMLGGSAQGKSSSVVALLKICASSKSLFFFLNVLSSLVVKRMQLCVEIPVENTRDRL